MKVGLYSKEKYFSINEENFREKALSWIKEGNYDNS